MPNIRESVRGILPIESKDGDRKLILMYRKKKWNEYFVVPWGGIEATEDHETALKREMEEEIKANVSMKQLIIEHISDLYNTIQYFYLCSHKWWDIGAGKWKEFSDRSSEENVYEVREVSLDELASLNIVPAAIKEILLDVLRGNVPKNKVIIRE